VGKVITVGSDYCTVIPLFNSSSYVAGRLERSRYDGLISGQGEGYNLLIMQNISKDALMQIKYGDMVMTSGLGQVYPKGIYIGQVRTIKSQGFESSIELEIEPIIDLSRLEYVVIIDPGVQ
jgi:rod shape-determining protein MreC